MKFQRPTKFNLVLMFVALILAIAYLGYALWMYVKATQDDSPGEEEEAEPETETEPETEAEPETETEQPDEQQAGNVREFAKTG